MSPTFVSIFSDDELAPELSVICDDMKMSSPLLFSFQGISYHDILCINLFITPQRSQLYYVPFSYQY